jgi:hypothetical protein
MDKNNDGRASERGSIEVIFASYIFILILAVLFIILIYGVAFYTKAKWYSHELETALNYATFADNMNGEFTGQVSDGDAEQVQQYFIRAFQEVTGSSYSGNEFTGGKLSQPVILMGVKPINAGDTLPDAIGGVNDKAIQPGYEVQVSVDLFSTTVMGVIISSPPLIIARYALAQSVVINQ